MKKTTPVLILQKIPRRSASPDERCAIRARTSQKISYQCDFATESEQVSGQNKDGVLKKYIHYSLRS